MKLDRDYVINRSFYHKSFLLFFSEKLEKTKNLNNLSQLNIFGT